MTLRPFKLSCVCVTEVNDNNSVYFYVYIIIVLYQILYHIVCNYKTLSYFKTFICHEPL